MYMHDNDVIYDKEGVRLLAIYSLVNATESRHDECLIPGQKVIQEQVKHLCGRQVSSKTGLSEAV